MLPSLFHLDVLAERCLFGVLGDSVEMDFTSSLYDHKRGVSAIGNLLTNVLGHDNTTAGRSPWTASAITMYLECGPSMSTVPENR